VLRDPGLLIGELVWVIVDYADSPLWDAHSTLGAPTDRARRVARVFDGGLVARPCFHEDWWASVTAREPLSVRGSVSFDVQVVGDTSGLFAIGVLSSEAMRAALTRPHFCVGNLQSFSVQARGRAGHNQGIFESVGRSFGVALASGDVIRTEIDHEHHTVTFYRNGTLPGLSFAAGDAIIVPPEQQDAWNDGHSTVKWPPDGKFYPCVSALSPKLEFRINATLVSP
jgi:hypothetical protein